MEISFKTHGDVQILEIDGAIGDPEAAAIRVKLEQKINQGRAKVLFDLANFPLENDAARKLLLGILVYVLNRGALATCCGVKSSQRPLLIVAGNKQVKIFFTRIEGLHFLQKNIPSDSKAALGHRRTEEQIREEALQKILDKYEIFQHSDDEDPFRLQFLIDQYKTAPNREALVIEKKAMETFTAVQKENRALEEECDELAKTLKSLMQYRKIPLNRQELLLKQNELGREVEEVNLTVAKMTEDIGAAKRDVAAILQWVTETRKASEEAIRELENHLKGTGDSFTREAAELQSQDAKEQADFEERTKK